MITFWDELRMRTGLTPQGLGSLRKREAKEFAKRWVAMGGYMFDIVLGWKVARGMSPFVFIVGEPMSGKTTFLKYLGDRFSLKQPWEPEMYYYAGGIEELIEEFVEGKKKKEYSDTVLAIDEGEGELDKWWSSLVKMLKLIHDLRGLHQRNIWAIVTPDIKSLASSLRGLNGSLLVYVKDWGVARTYVIRRDPADVSGSAGIQRYLLDPTYFFERPKDMGDLYKIAERRKWQIIKDEWERYKLKKEQKQEAITVF